MKKEDGSFGEPSPSKFHRQPRIARIRGDLKDQRISSAGRRRRSRRRAADPLRFKAWIRSGKIPKAGQLFGRQLQEAQFPDPLQVPDIVEHDAMHALSLPAAPGRLVSSQAGLEESAESKGLKSVYLSMKQAQYRSPSGISIVMMYVSALRLFVLRLYTHQPSSKRKSKVPAFDLPESAFKPARETDWPFLVSLTIFGTAASISVNSLSPKNI